MLIVSLARKFGTFIFFAASIYFAWKSSSWDILKHFELDIFIEPIHYEIIIKPYLRREDGSKQFQFSGNVEITVACKKHTNNFMIHGKNLQFFKAEFWSENLPDWKTRLVRAVANKGNDILKFRLMRSMIEGKNYVIHFQYTGTINTNASRGLYANRYKNDTDKYFLATYAEKNSARLILPCFDEPKYKATFRLTLIRHKSMKQSFSNSRLQATTLEDDATGEYVRDVFLKTAPMPTHSLSFLMVNFPKNVQKPTPNLSAINGKATEDNVQGLIELTEKILKALSNYFAMDYNNVGIDQLQIVPLDFNQGHMANWGGDLFSLDHDHSNQTRNALDLTHKLAHAWFDNLVTIDGRSRAWLQEALATHISTLIFDEILPNASSSGLFAVHNKQTVMALDAAEDDDVNHYPLSAQNEKKSILSFDRFTQSKGAAFLRMVHDVLGDKKFQKSLQEFMRTFQDRNATADDLYQIWLKYMPGESQSCALELFKDYTENVGYALVTVTRGVDGLYLSQQPFTSPIGNRQSAQDKKNNEWTVPLTYQTDKSFEKTTIFFQCKSDVNKSTEYPINYFKFKTKNINWLIANIDAFGYYRVNYDLKNWLDIKEALLQPNWSEINALTRAQMVDDLFNLAHNGAVTYDFILDLLEYLRTETSYAVWKPAYKGFVHLFSKINIENYPRFRFYLRNLTNKAYLQLKASWGWILKQAEANGEGFDIEQLNAIQILDLSCNYAYALDCFEFELPSNEARETVSFELRKIVYCSVIGRKSLESGAKYADIWSSFKKGKFFVNANVRSMQAFSCLRNSTMLEEHILNMLSDDEASTTERLGFIRSVYSQGRRGNVLAALRFLQKHLKFCIKSLNGVENFMDVLIEILKKHINDDAQLLVAQEIIEALGSTPNYMTVKTLLHAKEERMFWSARAYEINKYFRRLHAV